MKNFIAGGAIACFGLASAAQGGNAVFPASYDMPNGETGTFTYWDDSYNGSGNTTVSGDPLSGGLGDLTDGVIASDNWFNQPSLYVGWNTITPTITFRFAQAYTFDYLLLYVDDSNGNGGVSTPGSVDLLVNGSVSTFQLGESDGGAPVFYSIPVSATTDTIAITLYDGEAQWVFLSEVTFFAVPGPGAAGLLAAGGLMVVRRRR